MSRKTIILTEGHSNPHTAKTACSVIRYRPDEVVALLDSTAAGQTSADLLQVGKVPVVARLEEAPEANTLLIGIAPPGGKIPAAWRRIVLQAIGKKMDVVSGLHDFLSDDPEFREAARQHQVTLTDVRKNSEKEIARCEGIGDNLRVLTVGHDCSVGKMVTSIEVSRGLIVRGHDAKFIATGQTGIMVEGEGCPIDCVVADFVSGSVEKMIKLHQQREILLVEGQGSLVHPSYSAVTLGLLHGCSPQALLLCYEAGRETITGIDHLRIPPLEKVKELNEMMANIYQPCRVVGISMNGRRLSPAEAEQERRRREDQFQLPVCDVFRDGAERLVDAVEQLQAERAAGLPSS